MHFVVGSLTVLCKKGIQQYKSLPARRWQTQNQIFKPMFKIS